MVFIKRKKKKTSEELALEKEREQQRALGLQDEFQMRGFELVDWVQHHQGVVIGAFLLIILSTLTWSGYEIYQNRQNLEAAALYLGVIENLEEVPNDKIVESNAKARKDLEHIWQQFPRSDVAPISKLYVAQLDLKEGKASEASVLFEDFLRQISKENPLKILAQLGLAQAKAVQGDLNTGLAIYEEVLKKKWELNEDYVLFEAIKLASKLNQPAKVQDFTAQMRERFPNSMYVEQISQWSLPAQ